MATAPHKLTFHFEKAHSPTKILHVLSVLNDADVPILDSNILDQMATENSLDITRFDEARILAQQLGLLVMTKAGIQLTPRAHVLLKKRDSVQYDLLHFLFYTAWKPEEPAELGRSWFYRSLCDALWSMQQVKLDQHARLELAEQLITQAREYFQDIPGLSEEGPSVGRKTMDGAQDWLSHLKPEVLKEEQKNQSEFGRRQACSADLFLLAISRSYELNDSEVGVDLLLSLQRHEEICRVCLLEPLQFDRMLDWTLSIFPHFISQGTRSGSYGRFVRLKQMVRIEDVAQIGM